MEVITRVNWADVAVLIIILRSVYIGSQRGFFGELFYILGAFLAIIFGMHFYPPLANFINTYLFIQLNIADLMSFLIITLAFYFLFRFFYGLLRKAIKLEIFPGANRIGGGILGFCKGFIVSVLLFLTMMLTPINYVTYSVKTKSVLGRFFVKTGIVLYEKCLNVFSPGGPRDLTHFSSGARPLKFWIFQFEREDKLDKLLE